MKNEVEVKSIGCPKCRLHFMTTDREALEGLWDDYRFIACRNCLYKAQKIFWINQLKS